MLNSKQYRMIELKLENPLITNTDLAKALGVSRNTIGDWMKREEVKTELAKSVQKINQSATLHLKSQTGKLMNELLDMALSNTTEARVRNSALQYLIDRSMGKAAEQVTVDLQESTTDAADVLQGFKDFLTKNGYYKEGRDHE